MISTEQIMDLLKEAIHYHKEWLLKECIKGDDFVFFKGKLTAFEIMKSWIDGKRNAS